MKEFAEYRFDDVHEIWWSFKKPKIFKFVNFSKRSVLERCWSLSFRSLNTLNKETVFVETYRLKRIWSRKMFWYRLLWFKLSDLKPVSNADVCLFLCSRQFGLEPLIIRRTANNSYLVFQLYSFPRRKLVLISPPNKTWLTYLRL